MHGCVHPVRAGTSKRAVAASRSAARADGHRPHPQLHLTLPALDRAHPQGSPSHACVAAVLLVSAGEAAAGLSSPQQHAAPGWQDHGDHGGWSPVHAGPGPGPHMVAVAAQGGQDQSLGALDLARTCSSAHALGLREATAARSPSSVLRLQALQGRHSSSPLQMEQPRVQGHHGAHLADGAASVASGPGAVQYRYRAVWVSPGWQRRQRERAAAGGVGGASDLEACQHAVGRLLLEDDGVRESFRRAAW